ncbi:hypothetical protein ZOSMA_153G00390 [Zostera marina]|uniref:Uncharacterized protein n=1 Tax=Zostera marina TaxID=29655 RepID=A0A0K9PW48_ZOSMR|nr:hypothetical protein ZOSMA_153G00390 [Zostera marina]
MRYRGGINHQHKLSCFILNFMVVEPTKIESLVLWVKSRHCSLINKEYHEMQKFLHHNQARLGV